MLFFSSSSSHSVCRDCAVAQDLVMIFWRMVQRYNNLVVEQAQDVGQMQVMMMRL